MAATMTKYDAEKLFAFSGTYTLPELNSAYRRSIKENHPDIATQKGVDASVAHANMIKVNEAYRLLKPLFKENDTVICDVYTTPVYTKPKPKKVNKDAITINAFFNAKTIEELNDMAKSACQAYCRMYAAQAVPSYIMSSMEHYADYVVEHTDAERSQESYVRMAAMKCYLINDPWYAKSERLDESSDTSKFWKYAVSSPEMYARFIASDDSPVFIDGDWSDNFQAFKKHSTTADWVRSQTILNAKWANFSHAAGLQFGDEAREAYMAAACAGEIDPNDRDPERWRKYVSNKKIAENYGNENWDKYKNLDDRYDDVVVGEIFSFAKKTEKLDSLSDDVREQFTSKYERAFDFPFRRLFMLLWFYPFFYLLTDWFPFIQYDWTPDRTMAMLLCFVLPLLNLFTGIITNRLRNFWVRRIDRSVARYKKHRVKKQA